MLYFRSTPQSSTGISPARAFLARELRVPNDLLYGRPKIEKTDLHEYVKQLGIEMAEIHRNVRNKLSLSQSSGRYEGRAPKSSELQVGSKVLVFDPSRRKGVSPKLVGKWKGPCLVGQRINEWCYKLNWKGRFR